jgi:DNA-binding XRE family transcriptional regulator
MERLGAAKQKQHELDEGRAKLAAKQAEMAKLVKAKKEVPSELDDQIIAIEEGIMTDTAKLTVLRWAMNLDPDPTITLDESLKRANLGPWMANPQPRLAPQ